VLRSISIRTRLAVWHTAVLTLALLVFSATTWLLVRHYLHSDLRSNLLAQSNGLVTYLNIEAHDPNLNLPDEIDEYSRSLSQPHLLAVFDSANRAVYTNWTGARPGHITGSPESTFSFEWNRSRYLAVRQTLQLNGTTYNTFLAIPIQPVTRIDQLLAIVLAGLIPLFILVGAIGGSWLSRKALAPVDAITAKARAIGVGNLSERLPQPATGDELDRLTETWNDMLERLERAVSEIRQFTADASHELRTPVAIIRLAAENALRRSRSEADYREAIGHIQKQAENMTTLLEDLLFLARADARKEASQSPSLVDVGSLVDSALEDLVPLAEAKGVRLSNSNHIRPLTALGDPAQLGRLLSILLDNAVKYTPSNGTIQLTAHEEQDKVILQVADTGIGIPAEFRPRIFERFFRVDPSRSKNFGGSGLGLAIAATIAQQHSANIIVSANPGGGSVFTVSLPSAQET
jgi:heavy metal sensor kinase